MESNFQKEQPMTNPQPTDPPVKVNVVDRAEFFGKLVYDYIITNGGSVPDVSILPNILQITPEQLADGLKWCQNNDLLDLYIY